MYVIRLNNCTNEEIGPREASPGEIKLKTPIIERKKKKDRRPKLFISS